MKHTIQFILIFFTVAIYSQNDTIVTYFSYKGLPTSKIDDAHFYRVQTKESDSLFKMMQFKKSGRLMWLGYSTTRDFRTTKIGQHISFDRNDSISAIQFFDRKGKRYGKAEGWFQNRKVSYTGRYINGKREGLWRFYHNNGKIAQQGFFRKDSLLKAAYFDEFGNKIKGCQDCREKAIFTGGIKKFEKQFRKILAKVSDKISSRVRGRYRFNSILEFEIGVDGKIRYVEVGNNIPLEARSLLYNGLKNIEGWQPRILNNRKLPTAMRIPISISRDEQNFKTF